MSDVKAAIRKIAFAARSETFAARVQTGAVAAATTQLLAEIGPAAGHVIAGYMAMRTELDPLAAMTALHGDGARICVPVIEGKGLPLAFREWTPDAPMRDGPFGAMIPDAGDWLIPDTLIVPLVAFDRKGHRLGYGGGFYDRTLARLTARGPVRAIGFGFAAQGLRDVPVDATDITLDCIVTERGVIRP